jgi:hypothetical protein
VVVDNIGGGAGLPAMQALSRSAPDGHTMILAGASHVTIQTLLTKAGADAAARLAPVSLVSTSPHVLFVSSQLPVKTFQEFLDYARARPGRLNYASAGAGGVSHLGMEVILAQAGIQATHVAYRGISQATVDLAAGQVQFMLSSMASLKGLMEKGAVRHAGGGQQAPAAGVVAAAGRAVHDVVCHVRARGHALARGGAPAPGPGGRAGRARAEGQVPRDGHGPAVQHARGADRAHPGGDGAVAQGHRPGRHQR